MSHDTATPLGESKTCHWFSQGLKLPYLDWGNEQAPLLMLLHGNSDHACSWSIQRKSDTTSEVFYQCFAKLREECVTQEVQRLLPATDNPRTHAVVNYTRDHPPTVKLADACKTVGMSPRSLRRNFQKEMGISWEDYRLRRRMYATVEQLDKTHKPIGEIAVYVGYASQPAFSRAFNAFVGVGPLAYQRAKREG